VTIADSFGKCCERGEFTAEPEPAQAAHRQIPADRPSGGVSSLSSLRRSHSRELQCPTTIHRAPGVVVPCANRISVVAPVAPPRTPFRRVADLDVLGATRVAPSIAVDTWTRCAAASLVTRAELAAWWSLDHIAGGLPPESERKTLPHLIFAAGHQQIWKRHSGGAHLHDQLALRGRHLGQHNGLGSAPFDHSYGTHLYLHRSIKMGFRYGIKMKRRPKGGVPN
jgi:hypothetical protein